MRDDTAAWLDPMLTEAVKSLTYNDSLELMIRAQMPAAEADEPWLNWMAKNTPGVRGIDWIRYGQLLRERLGWHHHPLIPNNS
jgi:hypothetical protein